MLNISRVLISFFAIIIFLGILFNLNFSIFGFSEKITSARLSFLFLIPAIVYYVANKQGFINIFILKDNVTCFGFLCVFIIASSLTVSYLLNISQANSLYVLSAWLQFFLFFFFTILLTHTSKYRFINFFVIAIFLYVAILGGFFYFKIASSEFYQIRGELNEILPQGLNRFLNGYVFLWVIPISVLFGALPRSLMNILTSILIFSIGILLMIYSGSRQYLAGVVFLVFGASLVSEKKWRSICILIVFSIFLFLTFERLGFDELKTQLYRRFFEVTLEQSTYGSDRFHRYKSMFLFLREHPLTGLGPGGFFHLTGIYPDSGILQYLVENGIFLFILHIMSVFVVLIYMILTNKKYSQISRFLFIFFIVNIVVQNFFNELFLEYFTWLVLPLASFLKNYNPKFK